jgi:hypothetical protein
MLAVIRSYSRCTGISPRPIRSEALSRFGLVDVQTDSVGSENVNLVYLFHRCTVDLAIRLISFNAHNRDQRHA